MSNSQIDSAVARTPVEIWSEILSYLVDDPKAHPLCEPIEFEDYVFPHKSPHRFDKATYETLRAVCRSWRTIVEQCACILQEVVIQNNTPISNALPQKVGYLGIQWLKSPSEFPNFSSAFGAPSCRVIHIEVRFNLDSNLLRHIILWLAGLPSLRALRLRCGYNIPLSKPEVLFRLLSDTCMNLTSLSLSHFPPSPELLSLPRLKILIFHFDLSLGPLTHYFSGWSLPRLIMLGLTFHNLANPTNINVDLNVFGPITKGIKGLSLFAFTRPKYIINFPIDLDETFPSLEFLFLRNAPLHLYKPIPPQHPLQFIKFSSIRIFPIFSLSILPPEKHKRHQPVKLYLENEKILLEDSKFLDTLMDAGMEALTWNGGPVKNGGLC